MAKVYKFPPITEAVCEFRFEPSQTWDSTFFGLIYDQIKSDFPKKKQDEIGMKVQVGQQPVEVLQQVVSAPPRMKFLSDDERSLVQLVSDIMSISKLRPYDKWEKFRELILRALAAYQEENNPK